MAEKTHIVLDLVYTPEEGQEAFAGSLEECNDFVAKEYQLDFFTYKVVPMLSEEFDYYNKTKKY